LALLKEKKSELIDGFKTHARDTGSSVVQIALLTKRIEELSEHLKTHRKDHSSRRGLLMMIASRRRHLAFLKKHDFKKYEEILAKLNLRK
jgi:small subunit ribosomal protein S15